jgi:hypothetical protein
VTGSGRAEISAVGRGMWAHADVPAHSEAEDVSGLVLTMKPGRTVSGYARTQLGDPVALAGVCFAITELSWSACVQTDLHGGFIFEGVPPGYSGSAWCVRDQRAMRLKQTVVSAAESEFTLTVNPDED